MRNLLALAAAALLTFVGLGWYLGWYQVKTEPAGDGHRQVTIDINGPKIGTDLKKGEAKLHDLVEKKGTTPAAPPLPGTSQTLPPAPRRAGLLPPQTAQDHPTWGRPAEGGSASFPGQNDIPLPPPNVAQQPVTSGGNEYSLPPLPPAPPPAQ